MFAIVFNVLLSQVDDRNEIRRQIVRFHSCAHTQTTRDTRTDIHIKKKNGKKLRPQLNSPLFIEIQTPPTTWRVNGTKIILDKNETSLLIKCREKKIM